MLVFTDNKKRLRDHFLKDPALFAYHLGDLDDFHFPHCQWAVCYGERPCIEDCVLTYYGLATPTVLAFGLTERFAALLAELVGLLPEKFHCHYQSESRDILLGEYRETPFGRHIKMRLTEPTGDCRPFDDPGVVALDRTNADELVAFYRIAYPDGFFMPRMLETGQYFGYREAGRILAVTGVHVDSDEHRVAVLGSIATDPEHRGRGLATRLTGHLVRQLADEGKLVCLNVSADNTPAVRCYEKLGFVASHEYEEGMFSRRG